MASSFCRAGKIIDEFKYSDDVAEMGGDPMLS